MPDSTLMTIQEIKLKHPKTCNHCAAFLCGIGGIKSQRCSLGYETERVPENEKRIWTKYNIWEDLPIIIKPAEPCPKPKNIKECVEIRATGLDIYRCGNPNSPEYKSRYDEKRQYNC
jgi:hypothetical protein